MYTINEIYTNGFETYILDITSLLIILCGILTIISKNPIISVLFLIGLFGSAATYLIIVGLNFIGFSYIIVYVGAVSILFLFILMLINVRVSELQNNTNNSMLLAFFIGIFSSYSFSEKLPYDIAVLNNSFWNILLSLNNEDFINDNKVLDKNDNLFFVSSNNWDANLIETSHISSIGNILYTTNNMWLILVSFILLLAMVGAIIITIKSSRKTL